VPGYKQPVTAIEDVRIQVGTSRFRAARFRHFLDLIDTIPNTGHPLRILDIGGWREYWLDKSPLIPRPHHITLLNTEAGEAGDRDVIIGDARSMPNVADNSFDVVHSNSVIEHVGQWRDMMAMANEVRRVAPAYFVQTPYYWFPVEPHAQTPLIHWLPESWRLRLVMAAKLGPHWSKGETVDHAMRTIQDATLLDRKMFGALFPDATIVSERFCGLTKSMMAIRQSRRASPDNSLSSQN
jgi:hypothetical protein